MNRKLFLEHPAMHVLQNAYRRELHFQLGASVILLAGGVTLVIASFRVSVLLSVFGLGLAVLALRMVYQSLLDLRLHRDRLWKLLCDQPLQVVWIYTVVTQRMPFGLEFNRTGTLYLKLIDGDELSVVLPAAKLKLVSRYLCRLLPHAAFGYSPERHRTYQIRPEALLRQNHN